MKRYIKANTFDKTSVIKGDSWDELLHNLYMEYHMYADPDYADKPQKYIFLIDPDNNQYVAEITRYYKGDYELRMENVHKTGKKYTFGIEEV